MGRSEWYHQRNVGTTQKSKCIFQLRQGTPLANAEIISSQSSSAGESDSSSQHPEAGLLAGLVWLHFSWNNWLGSGVQNLQASLFEFSRVFNMNTMVLSKFAIEIPRWKMFSRWPGKTAYIASRVPCIYIVHHPGLDNCGPSLDHYSGMISTPGWFSANFQTSSDSRSWHFST